MELRHLRYFVAVAEELNFSRAAQRLHMTQPSLSRQIHDLEDELEVLLFVREPRQLSLTAAGQHFLGEARKLLQDADQAILMTQRVGRGEVGQLIIGYNSDQTGCGLLPAALQNFRARYKDVKLVLHAMNTARQLEALHNEEIDLGFSIRIGKESFELARPGISWHNLVSEPMIAVLPERHVLAEKGRVSLAELARLPFIGSSLQLNPQTGDYTPTLFEEGGFRPIEYLACDVPLRHPQMNLVSEGLGVSLAPISSQNKYPAVEGVVYRPLVEELVASHTFLWPTARNSPILETFMKMAIEEGRNH